METIFMNTENRRMNGPYKFVLNLWQILDLGSLNKHVALQNIYLLHIKKQCKIGKLKIITPTWNDEFELPECSYSVSGIHVYNEFIIKKHETLTGILNSLSINSYSCIRQ